MKGWEPLPAGSDCGVRIIHNPEHYYTFIIETVKCVRIHIIPIFNIANYVTVTVVS